VTERTALMEAWRFRKSSTARMAKPRLFSSLRTGCARSLKVVATRIVSALRAARAAAADEAAPRVRESTNRPQHFSLTDLLIAQREHGGAPPDAQTWPVSTATSAKAPLAQDYLTCSANKAQHERPSGAGLAT